MNTHIHNNKNEITNFQSIVWNGDGIAMQMVGMHQTKQKWFLNEKFNLQTESHFNIKSNKKKWKKNKNLWNHSFAVLLHSVFVHFSYSMVYHENNFL